MFSKVDTFVVHRSGDSHVIKSDAVEKKTEEKKRYV